MEQHSYYFVYLLESMYCLMLGKAILRGIHVGFDKKYAKKYTF